MTTHRLLLLTLAIAGFSCAQSTEPENLSSDPTTRTGGDATGDLVYANSFESDTDTVGCDGYGFGLAFEGAPQGGNRSLHVSGGCIWPHASFRIGPFPDGGAFVLRCWGKNLAIGGSVALEVEGDDGHGVSLWIEDTVWTAYGPTDTLRCPPGDTLSILMGAGGFAASAMLVDRVEVWQISR